MVFNSKKKESINEIKRKKFMVKLRSQTNKTMTNRNDDKTLEKVGKKKKLKGNKKRRSIGFNKNRDIFEKTV